MTCGGDILFKTETPPDIDKYSVDEVYKLIQDPEGSNLPKPIKRLKIIQILFEILGYNLSPDLALALASEPNAQLIIATAGGGKTTGSQIKVVLEKLWRQSKRGGKLSGDKVLSLVYNRHNVAQMKEKHAAIVSRIALSGIKGFDVDPNINAATMHSFCDQIRTMFVAKIGMLNYKLLDNNEAIKLMDTVKVSILNKFSIRGSNARAEDLITLYNYYRESMIPVEKIDGLDQSVDVPLDTEVVIEIFKLYNTMKKMKKKYDFSDMLNSVYEFLKNNPDDLKQVQKYFDYIVADEVQDFTPIMMSLLQLFVSDGTPLLCIGDEDQGIYNFRGADIYNTLDFESKFNDGKVYSLSQNRRCAANILELAKKVISENDLRFDKQLLGIRPGGLVQYVSYNTVAGENIQVLDQLKKMSTDELYETIVCYREKNSSIMLAELLENEGVPFNVLSGFTPFSHPLFRDAIAVMDALESPLDRKCMLNLYKVLPITREQMQYAAGYNPKTKKFDDVEQMPFWRLDYGSAYNRAGFGDCMELLKTISMGIGKIPMKNYFNTLLSMICKYHWNFIRKSRENLEVYDDYIESKVKTIFNVDYLYKEVYNRFSQRKDICRRNQEGRVGVTLSTFHSLKGLEYKNVIIMDMDDSIFPKFSMLESRDYTEMQKKALKECETRLYYVAVTRAKDNLYIYYNQDNPSRYVALYKDDSKSTVSTDTSDMNFFNESFGDYDDFEDFEDFEDLPEENLIDSTESDTPDLTDTDLSNTSQVGQSSFLANLLKKI